MKRKIYIASSWKNKKMVHSLAECLRNDGHKVFDFTDPKNKLPHCKKFVFGPETWAKLVGKPASEIWYTEFLENEAAKRAFASDKAGLDWCDTVLLVLPSGRSSHLEAGYGVGKGKELFIYGDLPKGEFDAMYGFAKECFPVMFEPELFAALQLHQNEGENK